MTEDVAPVPNARGFWFPLLDRSFHDSRTLAGLETAQERGLLNPEINVDIEVEHESDALDLLPDFVSPDDDDHTVDSDEKTSPNVEPIDPDVGSEGTSFKKPSQTHTLRSKGHRDASSGASSSNEVLKEEDHVDLKDEERGADKDAAGTQAQRTRSCDGERLIPEDTEEDGAHYYVFGKPYGSYPDPMTRPCFPVTKSGSTRVPWIHPLFWRNHTTIPQRLAEINKYRREKDLTPWRRLWSQIEQREWAGSINDELDIDVQNHMMDLVAGAVLTANEIKIVPFTSSVDGQGKIPTRSTSIEGALNIYGNKTYVVGCHGPPTCIHTGYEVEIPRGMIGRLVERSGLGEREGILVCGGEIDEDYQGELVVFLQSMDNRPYHIYQGEVVAQLVLLPGGLHIPRLTGAPPLPPPSRPPDDCAEKVSHAPKQGCSVQLGLGGESEKQDPSSGGKAQELSKRIAVPISRRERVAWFASREIEHCIKESKPIADEAVLFMLREWNFEKNRSRGNVKHTKKESIYSTLWGTAMMVDGTVIVTNSTKRYAPVAHVLNKWLSDRLPPEHQGDGSFTWLWSSITVNKNLCAKIHRDGNNFGPSIIREFGTTHAALEYWYDDPGVKNVAVDKMVDSHHPRLQTSLRTSNTLFSFNGNNAHRTLNFTGDDRYTIIFFLGRNHWRATPDDASRLKNIGFMLPEECSQANEFLEKFNDRCQEKSEYSNLMHVKIEEKVKGEAKAEELNLNFHKRTQATNIEEYCTKWIPKCFPNSTGGIIAIGADNKMQKTP